MQFFASTDIGCKKETNEDYILTSVNIDSEEINEKGRMFILCDGLGGASEGDYASKYVAEELMKKYYRLKAKEPFENSVSDLLVKINDNLRKYSKKNYGYYCMGTTIASVIIKEEVLHYNSVGDSRIYIMRGQVLTQISEDHSEVWKLYKRNLISKNEIKDHPMNNMVTSALGFGSEFNICKGNIELMEGDFILLCSDGLTDTIDDEDIEKVLQKEIGIDDKVNLLIELSKKLDCSDNISLILIHY